MKKIIIYTILAALIIIGITGCSSVNNQDKTKFGERPNFQNGEDTKRDLGEREDFQIDEETKNKVISFFEITQDLNEIKKYCEENRFNCFYYCKDINPNHEICDELKMPEEGPKDQLNEG